jgi:hypothetical protein
MILENAVLDIRGFNVQIMVNVCVNIDKVLYSFPQLATICHLPAHSLLH